VLNDINSRRKWWFLERVASTVLAGGEDVVELHGHIDKPVAVYCESGSRSGLAASILLRAGYPKVYNVPGSISAWKAAGFPVTKD